MLNPKTTVVSGVNQLFLGGLQIPFINNANNTMKIKLSLIILTMSC